MDGRVRLRQWLEGRLNTGYISGLIWIDKSKGIFKIPWKHHSKHTWQEDDAAIFKDWAVVTGRYHEGFDVPDWPMWKTRLRCALNKAPDIQEVRQHHNLHCDEPFKVYRFISKTESMWRANATRHASLIFDGLNQTNKPCIGGGGGGCGGGDGSSTSVTRFFPANTSQATRRTSPVVTHCQKKIPLSKPITLIQKTEQGNIRLKYINIPVRINNSSGLSLIKSGKVSRLNNQQKTSSISFPSSSFSSTHKTSLFTSSSAVSSSIVDDKSLSSYNQSNTDLPSFKLSDVMEPEFHQVCLRIQHLEHRVSDMIVNNPNGCCIYFGQFDENLSSAGPEPIEPQLYQYVSETNKYCVDMLLDNMQRGVVLSIHDGSIYAEKLCKCATFVYRPGNNGEFYFVDKLNRRDKMLIFDYRLFLEELHYYQRGLGEKPHVELILAFGQQIKENCSPDSLYVWCRLASCKAWFLLQRALMNEARSLVPTPSSSSSSSVLLSYSDQQHQHQRHHHHHHPQNINFLNNHSHNNNNNNRKSTSSSSQQRRQGRQSHVEEEEDEEEEEEDEEDVHELMDFSDTLDSINNIDFNNVKQELMVDCEVQQEQQQQQQGDGEEEEGVLVGSEELIEEENVVDHLVYGANCLSDELGVVVVCGDGDSRLEVQNGGGDDDNDEEEEEIGSFSSMNDFRNFHHNNNQQQQQQQQQQRTSFKYNEFR